MLFSANLGFLWKELALPDAIRAAKAAGFDAVECHWPYDFDFAQVKAALIETGLPMIGLNTSRGNVTAGDNGLSALPDRTSEARVAIDQALTYGEAIGTRNIHVMAGFSQGDKAHQTFVDNLRYACGVAAVKGISILIEPLNRYDAPGYFLETTQQAIAIISEVGAPNLKLMFDCYHIQIMQGDLTRRVQANLASIGHIQFAGVPDRGEPDAGEVNYPNLLASIKAMGWDGFFGAEYKPRTGNTADGLSWIQAYL